MSREKSGKYGESSRRNRELPVRRQCDRSGPGRWRRPAALIAVIAVALTGACIVQQCGLEAFAPSNDRRQAEAERASGRKWAERLQLTGLPNLHRVSENLYRGAQPTAEGMHQLEKLGVKTVVNLRSGDSDRDDIGSTRLNYQHIPMTTWNPDPEDITRFLKIVTDTGRTPVFVHCRHGADRTGTMCAIYRIVVEGWTKDQAIEEMTKGGFGYHSMWRNLVDYVRELDVESVKDSAELKE